MRWGILWEWHTQQSRHPSNPSQSRYTNWSSWRAYPSHWKKRHQKKGEGESTGPVLDVVTKELSTLRTTNVKNSVIFERYIIAQEKKEDVAQKAVELRDRHQCLKEMKYEDKILQMNITEMCHKDHAQYSLIQEEIRNRYSQASSLSDFGTFLDRNPCCAVYFMLLLCYAFFFHLRNVSL